MSKQTEPDIKKLIDKTEKIKEKMGDNIELLLERGKRLEQLKENATEGLLRNAEQLKRDARQLEFQTRWNNYAYYIMGVGILMGAGVGVVGGFTTIATLLLSAAGAGISYILGWSFSKSSIGLKKQSEPNLLQKNENHPPEALSLQNGFTPQFKSAETIKPAANDMDVPEKDLQQRRFKNLN